MSYLLDTNVISETLKPRPNPQVLKWLESIPSDSLFLSVLTIREIRKGIELLQEKQKKIKYLAWLEHALPEWFENRILSIDFDVADRWGYLMGSNPNPLPAVDSLLAATALTHNLKLVTRNVKDFQIVALEVMNPWEEAS